MGKNQATKRWSFSGQVVGGGDGGGGAVSREYENQALKKKKKVVSINKLLEHLTKQNPKLLTLRKMFLRDHIQIGQKEIQGPCLAMSN